MAKQTFESRSDCAQQGAFSLPLAGGRISRMMESPWKGFSSAEGILGGRAPTGKAQAAQTVHQCHTKPEGMWQWPWPHLSPPQGVRQWGFLWGLLDPTDGMANT